MKKNLITTFLLIALSIISCSKKEQIERSSSDNDFVEKLPYDTTAIDSFSAGATPNNLKLERKMLDSASLKIKQEEKPNAKQKIDDQKTKKIEEDKKLKETKPKEIKPSEPNTNKAESTT